MFDARYYAASDLQEMTDLRRKLVAMHLEKLFELVDARDIELLFFANDTCRPDWRFVDDLSDDAQKIVREIFDWQRSGPLRVSRRALIIRPDKSFSDIQLQKILTTRKPRMSLGLFLNTS